MAAGKAAKEALERMLPKVDDWGWFGGKKGELTGGDYTAALDAATEKAARRSGWDPAGGIDGDEDMYDAIVAAEMRPIRKRAKEQFSKSKDPWFQSMGSHPYYAEDVMLELSRLEGVGVPRRWTGKLVSALNAGNKPVWRYDRIVSDLMRDLTEDQRKVFVALLPDWDDSIESLAKTVKNL